MELFLERGYSRPGLIYSLTLLETMDSLFSAFYHTTAVNRRLFMTTNVTIILLSGSEKVWFSEHILVLYVFYLLGPKTDLEGKQLWNLTTLINTKQEYVQKTHSFAWSKRNSRI